MLHVESKMFDSLRGAIRVLLDHVDALHVLVEVLPRDLHHPARNSGRKHYVLRLARSATHVVENLFHVVLEALL